MDMGLSIAPECLTYYDESKSEMDPGPKPHHPSLKRELCTFRRSDSWKRRRARASCSRHDF